MTDVGRHPRIKLHTLSEIVDVKGYVGNFDIKILTKARYVSGEDCTACGDCATVCPVVRPDEFNLGLSSRKAIFTPFPQAVPSAYVININECLGHNPVVCAKCLEACEKGCINFHMSDDEIEERVGSIIVATGLEPYDPTELDEYGYTRFENVLTSLEFERLINAGGPTKGKLIRPTDRRLPKSVGFIQCVGSRSARKGSSYCSNTCCMNTIKSTLILKEHYPDIDIKVFYIDIRAFGKGFEDLFMRSRRLGVHYLRGLPGNVEELPDRSMRVAVENTVTGRLEFFDLEMLVLALGMKPAKNTRRLQEMLGLQLTADGFFLEAHPKLQPVDAASKGIFYAGCAESPKDIKDSVTQASADQINNQIDSMLEESAKEKILVFACNWCSYAGADYAGVSRLQYPSNVRIIRTMCSGRVDEKFIFNGFLNGAPVVLVSGCHIGDCHYIDANLWTEKRVKKIRKKMDKLGIRPERLQLEWISAAEGSRFAKIMGRMEKLRQSVSIQEISETIEILKNREETPKTE